MDEPSFPPAAVHCHQRRSWSHESQATLRGTLYERRYETRWFDPRTGEWIEAGSLGSGPLCEIKLPPFPTDGDWALNLVLEQ